MGSVHPAGPLVGLSTPRRALTELDERARRLFAQAHGRVLDLSDYSSFSLPELAKTGEQFDSIVSIMQISIRLGRRSGAEPIRTPGKAGHQQARGRGHSPIRPRGHRRRAHAGRE